MNEIRSELGQRLKDKPPLMQAGMRNLKINGGEDQIVVEQEIEIHRARTPAFTRRGSPQPALDGFQRGE